MSGATSSSQTVGPVQGEASEAGWPRRRPTALLALANGEIIEGFGVGATGSAVGEVCFNTAMTGYEEILTDPSYAGQIITFTFPHIGVVGTNEDDIETVNLAATPGARGAILHAAIGEASNYRATRRLDDWLRARGIIGLTGVDTRALTAMIRQSGMPNAVIAHNPDGEFDRPALSAQAKAWPGIDGMDLVPGVTTTQRFDWDETSWIPERGYGRRERADYRVVAIDYGIKRNILRLLSDSGCAVTVVPATASAKDILALKPDGVFLSNGPGDPAETGKYAVPTIKALLETRLAPLWHLPRPSDAGAGGGRADAQNAARPPRRQPSGEGLHHQQGRDRLDEPRLRRRPGEPARQRAPDPCLAVRRLELRHRADRPPGVLGAVPPRGVAGPEGQPLSVSAVCGVDGGSEEGGGVSALPLLHRRRGRLPSHRADD